MMFPKRLTVADRLLIAAMSLDGDERRSFTAEQLVVAAWEQFPDAFGLRGITGANGASLHPDSNRVFAEIMGSKPLRRDGYLEKVGDKTYQLTEAGRRKARQLSGREDDAAPMRGLDRALQDDVRRLYRSKASEKFQTGQGDHLTFHDACGFWGISPRSTAMELEAKLAHVGAVLASASDLTAGGPIYLDRAGGIELDGDGVARLLDLHAALAVRFAIELGVIRKRIDERGS